MGSTESKVINYRRPLPGETLLQFIDRTIGLKKVPSLFCEPSYVTMSADMAGC